MRPLRYVRLGRPAAVRISSTPVRQSDDSDMDSCSVSWEQQETAHGVPRTSDDSIEPEDETTPEESSSAGTFDVDFTTEASAFEPLCDAPEYEALSPADTTTRMNRDTKTVSTGACGAMLGPALQRRPDPEQSPDATTASASPAPIDHIMGEPCSRPEAETAWVVLQEEVTLESVVGAGNQEADVAPFLGKEIGFDDDPCPALQDHTYGRGGWTCGRRKRRLLTRSQRDALHKRSKRRCLSSMDADDSGWEGDTELSEYSDDEQQPLPELPAHFSPPRVLIKAVLIVAARII